MKIGDALMTCKNKFIDYVRTLSKTGNYTPEQLTVINEAVLQVEKLTFEALTTYITMFIIPNKNNLDLFIKSRISEEFLTKLKEDEYKKVKRYLNCMIDLLSD
jgi:hypothetical protein